MSKYLCALFILCLIVGCGGYKFEQVEMGMSTGKSEDAYNYLKKHSPKNPDIPHLYELGMTGHYANLFTDSSKAFENAESIAEERYTKSVSKEALSLITTDNLRPYAGTHYERLLSHYYSALNYIYAGNLDGAQVECRRATNLIQYFKGEDEQYDFFGTGFLSHFCGIVFEAAGEMNDAFISYKQAADNYQKASQKTGIAMPKDVGHSLVRVSNYLGFSDEYERYRRQYGNPPSHSNDSGELILFYETGFVPRKKEQTLTFPILKVDRFGEDDNKDNINFARTLRKREGMVVEDIELEYLLHVAMPTIKSNRPRLSGIEVTAGEITTQGQLIADVEVMAIETLEAERTVILIRTLIRALGKYLIFRKARKENKIAGALVNLAGILTESADTRSWQTLPNRIFIVRTPLPEGNHNLKLSFLNANGRVSGSKTLPNVKIVQNQISILNYRTYD